MDSNSQTSRTSAFLLVVLCGAPFLAGLDTFVVNLAIPVISDEFRSASLGSLSWVVNGYAVVYAALLIPMGRWADVAGPRRVFTLGLVLFTLASLVAAAAGSLPVLVAARAAQAIGAAALTPTSLGLLVNTVSERRRAHAVRWWAASNAIAAAAGPVVGGLLSQLSWRWVFLINIPIGVALLVAALRLVPADRTSRIGAVNIVGAGWAIMGAGALSLALVQGPTWGWMSTPTIGCALVAVAGTVALTFDSLRSSTPLIPASLLRVHSYRWANITMLLFSTAFAAGLLGLVLWLQDVWTYTAVEAGLAIAPGPLMVPLFAIGAARLLAPVPPWLLAAVGSALWAAGTVMIIVSVDHSPSYAAVLPGWLVCGIGVGLAMPTILAAATSSLPAAYASTGSSVINITRQIGIVLGVSILVAVIASAPPTATAVDAFQVAWWVVAAIAAVATVAATGMAKSGQTRVRDDQAGLPSDYSKR